MRKSRITNLFKSRPMTKEERKRFDNTRRDLQENPVKAMLFYAHYGTKETANETCDNPFERWKQTTQRENRAICNHLGIEYKDEDFKISSEKLAKESVSYTHLTLPTILRV